MRYEAPEDISGIVCSVEQVDAQIDKLVARGIPASRIGIVGNSMGGCLSLHIAYGSGRYSGQLGAVACERSFLAEDSVLDAAAAARFKAPGAAASPPLYMGHGDADPMIPVVWAERTRCRLGTAGVRVPASLMTFPGVAHAICEVEVQQLIEFFSHHLLGTDGSSAA
eukprot:gnl/TRDRNA2_/TRDRNA2_141916_c0_seq3.p2 gnl/TRDRNA2_/TRDRNA2_141916_c0~~gnl/TRDRNA2_/TRDRNA2_141916_c0_seq3.p2  ORF type:complete len:167 (+),score=27.04 gnl/TRDRNA2_/TRDRNA2_141916_c0_seq3:591-1091(+)